MDFRIARSARERYGFEESLFSSDGDAIVHDPAHALHPVSYTHLTLPTTSP